MVSFGGALPRGWIHCLHTISPRPRLLRNLAAFSRGALLHITLKMPAFLAGDAASDANVPSGRPRSQVAARVKLLYLVSYEHMGVALVSCADGCTCQPKEVDAHRRGFGRNVSVFLEAPIDVAFERPTAASSEAHANELWQAPTRMLNARCVLTLRILPRTSSGEHRWSLSRVTVSRIGTQS
jgi:hypothetical protein